MCLQRKRPEVERGLLRFSRRPGQRKAGHTSNGTTGKSSASQKPSAIKPRLIPVGGLEKGCSSSLGDGVLGNSLFPEAHAASGQEASVF